MKSRLEILDAVLLGASRAGDDLAFRSCCRDTRSSWRRRSPSRRDFAVALGFVVGPAGLTSVGHAAFYGLAAYLLAMMAPASAPADLVVTACVAIFGAALFAAVVGAVSIRSRGMYFILMTLAFGQLGYQFFHDTKHRRQRRRGLCEFSSGTQSAGRLRYHSIRRRVSIVFVSWW